MLVARTRDAQATSAQAVGDRGMARDCSNGVLLCDAIGQSTNWSPDGRYVMFEDLGVELA